MQHRPPVPQQPAVRARGQPPPDLAVQPVPLLRRQRDVRGERVQQPDVLLGRVADRPVELPGDHVAEQAAGLDFGPAVRQFAGPRPQRLVRWVRGTDLVIDRLELVKDRVAIRREHVLRGPERQVTVRGQHIPRPLVPHRRIEPVPRGSGKHQLILNASWGQPGLECAVVDGHPGIAGQLPPGLRGQFPAKLDTGDPEAAPGQRGGGLAGGAADLQQLVPGPQAGQPDQLVIQLSGIVGAGLLVTRRG